MEGYSDSTEPIDAVNILPLARFEPTTSATPPSATPDADATDCIYMKATINEQSRAAISPPAERHLNSVSLEGRYSSALICLLGNAGRSAHVE